MLMSRSAQLPAAAPPWGREQRRFVEAAGETTREFGLGRLIGRTYATLFLSPSPMSLDEIAEGLSISKASASIVMRQLAGWGAARLVSFPGDRRDHYEAETEFGRLLKRGILPALQKKVSSAGLEMERALQSSSALNASSDARPGSEDEAGVISDRLKLALKFQKRLDRVLRSKLLIEWM